MQRHLYLFDSFWAKKYSGIYYMALVNTMLFSFENFVFHGQLVKHYFRDRFLVVALEPSLASLDDPVAVSVELSSRLDLPGKIKKTNII